jgi:DNA-binding CsgD family transcriptional regulator
MASHSVSTTKVNPSERGQTALAELVRLLAVKVEAVELCGGADPITEHCENEEILLDIDMDGARYLLLRMPPTDHGQVRLSPREHEIVRMVAQGYPNKVIADVLNISTWTVCTHLRRIFAKAGVTSRAAMVARFFEGRRASTNPTPQDTHGRRQGPNLAKLHP